MTRKTATAALALAATTAAAGALVADGSRATAARAPKALELVLRLSEAQVSQIDAPPLHSTQPADSPGDAIVLHAPVHKRTGAKAGLIDAVFTATARGDREQVVATFTVGRDQIAVQGIDGAATTDRGAILGGTGRYAAARGTLTATQQGATRRFRFSFRR